ncbi:hypothetical protein EVAR_16890_1 [Eumeta japonica]|uniref:Uncharacterized protein n=1 Tax=Eumeta variegata TaxID=151549 RepID=A0A4C1TVL9_EUMVA|nr:hypothetical protein EVAR_16890_1 [Eumeta japonica]
MNIDDKIILLMTSDFELYYSSPASPDQPYFRSYFRSRNGGRYQSQKGARKTPLRVTRRGTHTSSKAEAPSATAVCIVRARLYPSVWEKTEGVDLGFPSHPLLTTAAPATPSATQSVKETYYSTPWRTVRKSNCQDASASH